MSGPSGRTTKPLQPGAYAWGSMRADLGLSIRELAERSGVNRGLLSLTEAGRYIPTAEEWRAVLEVLLEETLRQGYKPHRLRQVTA